MAVANLVGQRFGHLTVLAETTGFRYESGRHIRIWHCRCDCGKELDVRQDALMKGQKSCGCGLGSVKRKGKYSDITGASYGDLVVVQQRGLTEDKEILWDCVCVRCQKHYTYTRQQLKELGYYKCPAPLESSTFSTVISMYKTGAGKKQIAEYVGISIGKVTKILITKGLLQTEKSVLIAEKLKAGLTPEQIRDELGISASCYNVNMPYEIGEYNSEFCSNNSINVRKSKAKNQK